MDSFRIISPLMRHLDSENAHALAVRALKWGLVSGAPGRSAPLLESKLWGYTFKNPLGIAAGFDKDGEVIRPLFNLGFGFVEIGSVTPHPQPGNPRPRLFRLQEDRAVINRMGFNSKGHDAAAAHLATVSRPLPGPLGVNLGRNKETIDAASDYVKGVERLGPFADYLVINVSSPNTPGLRALQSRDALEELLGKVGRAVNKLGSSRPPLILKVAPDLTEEDIADIASVSLAQGLDGLAVCNTTLDRPRSLRSAFSQEAGGLSGRPLFRRSTEVLRRFYDLTNGQIPLIGIGGIDSGKTAYLKIRAGAQLLQLYSALVFEGPQLIAKINDELAACLKADGFRSLMEAVGADHRGEASENG